MDQPNTFNREVILSHFGQFAACIFILAFLYVLFLIYLNYFHATFIISHNLLDKKIQVSNNDMLTKFKET